MYMENVKEHYWRYSLITIILGLGVILFFKITPFSWRYTWSIHHLYIAAWTDVPPDRKAKYETGFCSFTVTGGNNLMFLNPNHIGDLVGNQQNSKY